MPHSLLEAQPPDQTKTDLGKASLSAHHDGIAVKMLGTSGTGGAVTLNVPKQKKAWIFSKPFFN